MGGSSCNTLGKTLRQKSTNISYHGCQISQVDTFLMNYQIYNPCLMQTTETIGTT